MDTVQRLFHLAYQDPKQGSNGEILKPGFHYLVMDAIIQGEYGQVRCRCIAQIETPFDFKCFFMETSGEPEGSLFAFRQDCIGFFNYNILPLFNPLTRIHDEVPFSEASESQNP